MNITVEQLPDCHATIRVQVPREKVAAERKAIATQYAKQANVPGFRPGKAPLSVIEKKFAKNIVEEAESRLVSEGYRIGVEQEKLAVLTALTVDEKMANEDGSLSFEVKVLTAPEFTLPNYKGIAVQLPKHEISEEQVTEAIESLRQRAADHPLVEGRLAAEAGDVAVINYHGFCEDKKLSEYTPACPEQLYHAHNQALMLKEPNFLPGFATGIIGAEVGAIVDVVLTLAADFPIKELAGKEVKYVVNIKALHTQVLPELNDAFAQKTRLADDAAGIAPAVRGHLERELANRQAQAKAEQIITFPIPQEILNDATRRRAEELVTSNRRRGVADAEIIENQQQIMSAAGEQATFDVKTNFILNKIANAEQVQVSDAELTREVLARAQQAKMKQQQLQKLAQNRELLQQITDQLRVRKVIALLAESAVVEFVDPKALEATPSEATA
jgi:trigger factor